MKINNFQKIQCTLLIGLFLSQLIFLPAAVYSQNGQQNDKKPVIVTVGQPNIWSLEQAHYLLARIRERNLGIRNPALKESDIDPNAIGGTRLDAFRSVFELGLNYSQGLGITNEYNQKTLAYNETRRQDLFARRASLFDQKNALLAEEGRLNAEKINSTDRENLKIIENQIKSNKEQLLAVNAQLDNITSEITLVGAGASTLTDPTPPSGSGILSGIGTRIGSTLADEAQKEAYRNSRLAASVKVDNYIQMQYELLAKQLTLLRDDVGPNERLVFLELPTSIYATPGKGNERTAQCWWKVDGYERDNRFAVKIAALKQQAEDLKERYANKMRGRSTELQMILRSEYTRDLREINEEITNTREAFIEDRAEAKQRGGIIYENPEDRSATMSYEKESPLLEFGDFINLRRFAYKLIAAKKADIGATAGTLKEKSPENDALLYLWDELIKAEADPKIQNNWNKYLETSPEELSFSDQILYKFIIINLNKILEEKPLYDDFKSKGVKFSDKTKLFEIEGTSGDKLIRLNRLVLEDTFPTIIAKSEKNEARTIDLIPRQSSINVDDVKEVVKDRGLKLAFSFLMGIGGSANYQQRRERFEQFQQQEVYAAGFGKGESVFGWTFSPAPGTKRLVPGIRTTYAVMVVPRDATKIRFKALGREFESDKNQLNPDFTEPQTKTITLDIPSGPDEGFFVTRMDYPPIAVNNRSVVVLRGDFSSQTGVLINGTSLTRTVGVASPWLGSERESANPFADLGEPDQKIIKGYYEVINDSQIIMVFLMPKDFKGTPQITLVSPGRARALNDLTMNINGQRAKLNDVKDGFVIGSKSPEVKIPLAINSVEIFPVRDTIQPPMDKIKAKVSVVLNGIKSDAGSADVYVNAQKVVPENNSLSGNGVFNFDIDLPLDIEKITVTAVQGKETVFGSYDNPAFARAQFSKITYDPGVEEDPSDDTVTLNIEGQRLQDIKLSCRGCDELSLKDQNLSFKQGAIVVRFINSESVKDAEIILTDNLTQKILTTTKIYRRPAPKADSPNNRNGNNNNSGNNRGNNNNNNR